MDHTVVDNISPQQFEYAIHCFPIFPYVIWGQGRDGSEERHGVCVSPLLGYSPSTGGPPADKLTGGAPRATNYWARRMGKG